MNQHEAEQTLSVIRTLMERGTRYTNLSGHAGIAAGALALAGALARVWFHTPFLTTWMCVLVAACGSTVLFTAAMARANGEPVWTRQAQTVTLALAPSVATVLILTVVLARAGQEVLLPGIWMLLWGVGALAMSFFTPRVLSNLGLTFLAAGALTLLAGLQNDAWTMGLTFGAIHLLYGALLAAAPVRAMSPEAGA
jgi:hypothetical protein